MEITLSQLVQLAPDLASSLREAIRSGQMAASRQTGVAGRPYVLTTDALRRSGRPEFQQLADVAENTPLVRAPGRRSRMPSYAPGAPVVAEATFLPLIKMMESQHMMLQGLVDVLTHEMKGRRDRIDRQQLEIQELSYKLGQAHQEIGRLERSLGELRSHGRVTEA